MNVYVFALKIYRSLLLLFLSCLSVYRRANSSTLPHRFFFVSFPIARNADPFVYLASFMENSSQSIDPEPDPTLRTLHTRTVTPEPAGWSPSFGDLPLAVGASIFPSSIRKCCIMITHEYTLLYISLLDATCRAVLCLSLFRTPFIYTKSHHLIFSFSEVIRSARPCSCLTI